MFKKYVSVKLVSIRNGQEYFNGYELKTIHTSMQWFCLSIHAAETILLEVGTDPLILAVNAEA